MKAAKSPEKKVNPGASTAALMLNKARWAGKTLEEKRAATAKATAAQKKIPKKVRKERAKLAAQARWSKALTPKAV